MLLTNSDVSTTGRLVRRVYFIDDRDMGEYGYACDVAQEETVQSVLARELPNDHIVGVCFRIDLVVTATVHGQKDQCFTCTVESGPRHLIGQLVDESFLRSIMGCHPFGEACIGRMIEKMNEDPTLRVFKSFRKGRYVYIVKEGDVIVDLHGNPMMKVLRAP